MLVRGVLTNSGGQTTLQGTDLGGTAAPAFTLSDQNGAQVSLASLRGHPVVLSFMNTHCPDECPLAGKLQTAMQALGAQSQDVRWVEVSTDPVGDTAQTAQSFLLHYQLEGSHYLLGDQAQLAPVWQAYSVAVTPNMPTATASNGSVSQTDGLYLIDGQGRERAYLDSNFTPSMLEGDLRTLL